MRALHGVAPALAPLLLLASSAVGAQALPVTGERASPDSMTATSDQSPAEVRANTGPLDSVQQQPLFGDWAPRKRLAEEGVSFGASWVLEPAWNAHGYRGSGVNTVSSAKASATFDLGRLGLVDNAKVQVVVTDRFGQSTNAERTGSYIQNQAYYGQGRNVRFNELSYEQTFVDNRLSVKGGFYPMGNDFGKLPYTCNLTNNGNCGHPLGPVYSSGWRDDPTGQWGGRVKWTDRSGWYAQVGAYDVNTLRNQPHHGFDLSFAGTHGAFVPVEVGYDHGKTPADYAGTIRFGGYYDTSRANVLGETGRTVRGRSGVLVQAAQQVWKPHADTVRGIAVFGVFTAADAKTGLFRTYYEAGASWRGPVASRPNDILSVGWAQANINDRVGDAQRRARKDVQTFEQMWELNYGVQITPSLLIRPSVQYVVRPGAYQRRPDTTVFVCHLQLTL